MTIVPPDPGEPRRPHGPRDPGDAWVVTGDGTRYWGRFGAAGLLAVDPLRGVLLQQLKQMEKALDCFAKLSAANLELFLTANPWLLLRWTHADLLGRFVRQTAPWSLVEICAQLLTAGRCEVVNLVCCPALR